MSLKHNKLSFITYTVFENKICSRENCEHAGSSSERNVFTLQLVRRTAFNITMAEWKNRFKSRFSGKKTSKFLAIYINMRLHESPMNSGLP